MKLFKKHTETGEPKIPIITRKTKIMWACTGVTALAAVGSVIYDHVSEGSAPALPATGEEIKAVGENGVEYLIEAVEDAGDAIATATADAAADID